MLLRRCRAGCRGVPQGPLILCVEHSLHEAQSTVVLVAIQINGYFPRRSPKCQVLPLAALVHPIKDRGDHATPTKIVIESRWLSAAATMDATAVRAAYPRHMVFASCITLE